MKKWIATGLALTAIAFGATAAVRAEDADSPGPAYYSALRGKKVGFVSISMGFDLMQGWLAGMQRQAR